MARTAGKSTIRLTGPSAPTSFSPSPERYYLYQPQKMKEFAAEIGYDLECTGAGGGKLAAYMELAEQVLQQVRQDQDLVQQVRTRLDGTCYQDPQLHLLADDIIYFGAQLHRGKYWPAPSDYDPGITAPQWQAPAVTQGDLR